MYSLISARRARLAPDNRKRVWESGMSPIMWSQTSMGKIIFPGLHTVPSGLIFVRERAKFIFFISQKLRQWLTVVAYGVVVAAVSHHMRTSSQGVKHERLQCQKMS